MERLNWCIDRFNLVEGCRRAECMHGPETKASKVSLHSCHTAPARLACRAWRRRHPALHTWQTTHSSLISAVRPRRGPANQRQRASAEPQEHVPASARPGLFALRTRLQRHAVLDAQRDAAGRSAGSREAIPASSALQATGSQNPTCPGEAPSDEPAAGVQRAAALEVGLPPMTAAAAC